MSRLIIEGERTLTGKILINGAKNSALPIMAACLLVEGPVKLYRIPNISDVKVMIKLLKSLGAKVTFNSKNQMTINAKNINTTKASYELVKKIHASFDIAGPLIARFRQAEVPLPGGCVLGTRAVDMHIEGFKALGVDVVVEHGVLKAKAKNLKGARIGFRQSSVGATKNVIMAACLADGRTIIQNTACEPEVNDLVNFLITCGAKIEGVGTRELKIEGVKKFHSCEYEIIPDRIEAGTYLLAGAITQGEVTALDISPNNLGSVLDTIEHMGQKVIRDEKQITVIGQKPILPVNITTFPFPGFPTDLQPQISSVLTFAKGSSLVEETIFDGRFNYVDELRRMGANIIVKGQTSVIEGIKNLTGAPVEATDIRAGSALVLAGLAAQGKTEISGVEYIDRGYEKIEKRLSLLGAKIRRV